MSKTTCAAVAIGCVLFSSGTAAAQTPPPTIIEIRTSPLCTTLRESVAPVIAGLTANEGLIREGSQHLDRWSYDYGQESGTTGAFWKMDRLRVEIVVNKLVKNFDAIDKILNDSQRFPGRREDAALTPAALHDGLQAVEDAQRKTLDDLYGPVDTSMLAEMMELPAGAALVTRDQKQSGPLSADDSDSAPQHGTALGAGVQLDQGKNDAIQSPQLADPLPYAGPLGEERRNIQHSEAALSTIVTQAIARCVAPAKH